MRLTSSVAADIVLRLPQPQFDTTLNQTILPVLAVPSVPLLILNAYPSTITRFVIPVWVYPIDRKRLIISVCIRPILEWCKFVPLMAYRDSPRTIILVIALVLVRASLMHPAPDVEKPCPCLSVLSGMFFT